MAERLASIFGTEKDKVNCPFYFKIGACRHGDRCSRLHNKPSLSQTLLIPNMYNSPAHKLAAIDGETFELDEKEIQEKFDEFYEDIFAELGNFGEIEELNVCDNLGDHLVGNVYAKFKTEEQAALAREKLLGRFYAGRPIIPEFSPVTDFREARCRQYDQGDCNRGGYCNFMHLRNPARDILRKLFRDQRERFGGHSRSRSPKRDEKRERERDRDERPRRDDRERDRRDDRRRDERDARRDDRGRDDRGRDDRDRRDRPPRDDRRDDRDRRDRPRDDRRDDKREDRDRRGDDREKGRDERGGDFQQPPQQQQQQQFAPSEDYMQQAYEELRGMASDIPHQAGGQDVPRKEYEYYPDN